MKFLFHNPHHRPFLGISLFARLTRNPMSKKMLKHKYIIDFLIKNGKKLYIFLDYKDSSFPKNPKILGIIRKLILKSKRLAKLEVYLRGYINGIKKKNIEIIDDKDIQKNDIMLIYANGNLDHNYQGIESLANIQCIKIIAFNHYHSNTSEISKNYNRIQADYVLAENNLKNNSYFCSMFPYYGKSVYTLPFYANERFIIKKDFSQRKNYALSIGGLVDMTIDGNLSEMQAFYHEKYLQPIRGEIYENKENLKGIIETPSVPLKAGNPVIQGIINALGFSGVSKYYNLDMVDAFNEYQMFICSEELCGLPGIGFVEGMACGCAYIGIIDSMYLDLGLIPGKHYIGYNGTLSDLIDKIKYYQKHQEELATIAKNGKDFVNNNLRGDMIAKKFFDDMETLSKNGNTKDVKCSFIKG